MDPLGPIFEAVRSDALQAVWSRGVSLSRSVRIHHLPTDDDDEIVVQMAIPVVVLSPTIRLFIEDEDWLCDCSPKDDVCEHVVAALILLKRADSGEIEVEEAEALATISYRFNRAKGGLALERVLVSGAAEWPLVGSAAAAAMGAGGGPKAIVSPLDIRVEQALGHRFPEWLPGPQLKALFRVFAGNSALTLDGQPVKTSLKKVGIIVVVEDADPGFMVTVANDPAISQVFNCGVALCGNTLRPLADSELTGREREDLGRGKHYSGSQVQELVGNALPSLRKRLPVDIRTTKLPGTCVETPRIQLQIAVEGHELTVLPQLVYGQPAIARVDGDHLVLMENRIPVRDLEEESRLLRGLNHTLGLVPGHRAGYAGEAAVSMAGRLKSWTAGEVTGHGLDTFFLAPPLQPDLSIFEGELDVSFGSPGRGQADTSVVLKAWRAGASLVPLMSGGWAPLPADWLARFGDTLSDLLSAKAMAGHIPPSAVADVVHLCRELDQPVPADFAQLHQAIESFDQLPEPALPADLKATLRTYQHEGVRWLSFLRDVGLGALLCDDMGLGKTLQALCVLKGRALVVCPTSVLHNWAAEIARFRPALSVGVYHGKNRALDSAVDVTLTTYAILRLDIDLLAAEDWDTVVLDEAQAIKNPQSKVAQAAHRLPGTFRMTLTGTPVENRLDELWSQAHFANPGLLGGRRDFQERYARPIAEGTPGVAQRLRSRLRPFLLRRLKRDVAPELPPRIEQVLRCQLSDQERQTYNAIRAASHKDVVARLHKGGNVIQVLELLLRLRQAACHTGLLPGHEDAERSAKVTLLAETLDQIVAEGHKALVFSQWTKMLDRVEPALVEMGLAFERLDGSTRDREGVVNRFQANDGPPVLLLSLKAGGTGLNLTAADHVFLLDPWWNPAAEDQAADRAHRIGQDKPVMIHRLVSTDTVEERILALQAQKRALADAALSGADRAASLTRDDLMMLLEP